MIESIDFDLHHSFSDSEMKKLYLDISLRSYLTEELLSYPEKANLEECKSMVTLSIAGNAQNKPVF